MAAQFWQLKVSSLGLPSIWVQNDVPFVYFRFPCLQRNQSQQKIADQTPSCRHVIFGSVHSSISAHWRFQFSGLISLLRRLTALLQKERGRRKGASRGLKKEKWNKIANFLFHQRRALKRGLKIKLKFQLKVEPSYEITSLEEVSVCMWIKRTTSTKMQLPKREEAERRPERHNNNNARPNRMKM